MIKGCQTKDKEQLLTIEDIQYYIYDLEKRIDKAIKYIENNTCWELKSSKVIETLKGEDNE